MPGSHPRPSAGRSPSSAALSLGAGESTTLVVSLDAGKHQATASGDYDGSLTIDCAEDGSVLAVVDAHRTVHQQLTEWTA